MTILRALPYLLLALVLGVAGFGAGVVVDPVDPPTRRITAELDPEAPALTRRLAEARARASDLAGRLERANQRNTELQEKLAAAQAEIERLRARLGEAAGARDEAQDRAKELENRIQQLQQEGNEAGPPPASDTQTSGGEAEPAADTAADPAGDTDAAVNDESAPTPADARPRASALDAASPSPAQRQRVQAGVEAYRAGNYETAYRRWLPAAQAGYARAQLHLGGLFFEGRGVPQDNVLAYAWLTLAEENGAAAAGDILSRLEGRIADAEREAAIDLITSARS